MAFQTFLPAQAEGNASAVNLGQGGEKWKYLFDFLSALVGDVVEWRVRWLDDVRPQRGDVLLRTVRRRRLDRRVPVPHVHDDGPVLLLLAVRVGRDVVLDPGGIQLLVALLGAHAAVDDAGEVAPRHERPREQDDQHDGQQSADGEALHEPHVAAPADEAAALGWLACRLHRPADCLIKCFSLVRR